MPVRSLIRSSALLLACLLPHRSTAQSTTSLLPDANVLPEGAARLRVLSSWTRYDELLGTGGPRNLAWSLNIDSLGSRQAPVLGPAETAIRTASGLSTFRLTAGNVVAAANSRVVTAPLIIEYGLTKRLTFGVVVPLVETRTTLYAQLNPTLGQANVGPNPALGNAAALAQNAALVRSVRNASDSLQRSLTNCQSTPTSAGCAALLAQQSTAQGVIQSSGALASALEQLYGTDVASHPGQPYVPLQTDPVQTAINSRIQSLRDQLRSLLGTDLVSGQVAGAAGPGARAAFQALQAAFGQDSLQSTDRASIGDISIGATYQFVNTYGDTAAVTAGGRAYRISANGTFRIGTGQPANTNRMFDVGTGYGQPGFEGGLAADVQLTRRLSASVLGAYTAQLGTVAVARVPNAEDAVLPMTSPLGGTYAAGNVLSVSVVPRYRLARYFAFTGLYSMVRVAADQYTVTPTATTPVLGSGTPVTYAPIAPYGSAASTAQQVGFGFLYSTIIGPARAPGAIPVEVAFSHLETIAGSGGPVAKTYRDQIEMRVYWVR